MNRKLLADKIYNNNEALEKLNKLTFKYVLEEILNRIKTITELRQTEIIIIDAPLLFESGLERYCNYVIALVADFVINNSRNCDLKLEIEKILKKF